MPEGLFEHIPDIQVETDMLFPTGFVIELGIEQYFQKWKKKRICCSGLSSAKYFVSCNEAEAYTLKFFRFVGLNPYVCHVCWTLLAYDENRIGRKNFWAPDRFVTDEQRAIKFPTYQEAESCQREQNLGETCIVELHGFRVKQIETAA